MIKNGWLGAKTKQGFFRKEGKEIQALDPETFEYSKAKK